MKKNNSKTEKRKRFTGDSAKISEAIDQAPQGSSSNTDSGSAHETFQAAVP